jgi:dephospho-CoA kinase
LTVRRAEWLGIAGPIASGKTTLARHVELKYGYRYVRYSEILARMLEERGETIDRGSLQRIGATVFEEMGGEGLTRLLIDQVRDNQFVVVDGIRHLSDVQALRQSCGEREFVLIYLLSGLDIRKRRYEAEAEITSPWFHDACAHAVEAEVAILESQADFVLRNEGSLQALFDAISPIAMFAGSGSCR